MNQSLKSLSDNHSYPQVCLNASQDDQSFNEFKRNRVYTQILEHTTEEQGAVYLNIISKCSSIIEAMPEFAKNDLYGNPIKFKFGDLGAISPSTLRYVKVLMDLETYFGSLDGFDIAEIGCGYGGQCRIINTYFHPATYCLVDIKPALCLAQRFIDNFIIPSVMSYRTMNELEPRKCDLLISNYAFSELPRVIQDVYLEKVVLNARRGYMTYNHINPAEFDSYSAEEIVRMIPGAKISPEEPLTYPGNCIVTWK